ncbi:metal-dependent hydrolase [Massilia glaciei]|uniref:Metal-dependent hydrolase n=1 Tax=Massilia glaciei TaxID=1524097 RepID=A0A2U2HMJ0_9BURK|nr:metal-dependent hydrolase [Massilia glaciei]PWF48720.1 metal-dependent hydrolase [Massilia glaciei]
MDNLSHSVVGLAAGELIHHSLPQETDPALQRVRRRLLLSSTWAASNFPDLDLVLTPLLPAPLGYLLHHRGHTHTLLYAVPQAILLCALIWLCWPGARRLLGGSAAARRGLLLSVGAGFLLHLLMDSLNSYGIHPFHPVDSRWFYGDMVFIIEPLFWVAFGVPLALRLQNRFVKFTLLALLTGAPLLFARLGFLHPVSLAILLLAAAAVAWGQLRGQGGGRAVLAGAFGIALGFIALQGGTTGEARRQLAQALHAVEAGSRVADSALSAFPSNPLCWRFASIQSDEAAGSYTLSEGVLSIAPALLPAAACPGGFGRAPLGPDANVAVAFAKHHHGSLRALRALRNTNCHADAWLRFARIPRVEGDTAWDSRFGAGGDGNFSTIRLDRFKDQPCPRNVPQWEHPRADLLTAP